MSINSPQISCIILAGGKGKRVGGVDKGLLLFEDKSHKNKPLIEHVIDAVKNQVDDLVISANRNIEIYDQYAAKVINDSFKDYQGPLAGIASCLKHCKHELVLVVACDTPKLPGKLVERLAVDMQNNSVCIATVGNRHQLAMIIRNNLSDSIQQHLGNKQLSLIKWVESVAYKTVGFDDMPEAFINLNQLSNSSQ
jgi:molybdopterin-guanine dinucleotide biosynthesis protein A